MSWPGGWTPMSELTGDMNTPPPSPTQVLEAVKLLSAQYEENAQANRDLADEFKRRKREARWIALGILIVIVGVCATAFIIRHADRRIEADRRRDLADQIFTQRESQVQGCERGNDQRITLAQVIAQSYDPGPALSVPPGFEQLVADAAARSAAKRDALLSLPGVQVVDCQGAYPPPKIGKD